VSVLKQDDVIEGGTGKLGQKEVAVNNEAIGKKTISR